MRVGLYCGSFNPWHCGHEDILNKALKIFDKVVVLMCQNPEKPDNPELEERYLKLKEKFKDSPSVVVHRWKGTIKAYLCYAKGLGTGLLDMEYHGFIRGLRNGADLDYEMTQMCLHEDTGMNLPFVCFLTDRNYKHVSSTAIRGLDKLGLKHDYTMD